ncbi:sugar ABC transporter permease [Microlunatus parietis]
MWIWGFLTPTIILYGLYTVYPVIGSYWYSLVEWNGFDAEKTFVGLQNYRAVLDDPLFWNSFKTTFLFMIVSVPIKLILTLGAALLLNSPRMPLSNLFRTALFLPVVTTTAIVGVVMQLIFDPASGPVNQALIDLGFIDEGIPFLADTGTAFWTVVAVDIWKWFGITMIYWLAALQTVPTELYEASWLDGASAWQSFKSVTLPLLKPFAIIISLLELEGALHIFDLILTMTNGGPFFATEVVEIYIYRWAFAATVPQLGHASAAAVIFGLFVCAVGALQLIGIRAVRRSRAEMAS